MPAAIHWTPTYPTRTTPELWGDSHWSVLQYVEERCVTHRGILSPEWMRINPNTHYQQYAQGYHARGAREEGEFRPSAIKAAPYPAMDNHFATKALLGHDEYDCLDDLVFHGFITCQWPVPDQDGIYQGAFGQVTDGTRVLAVTTQLRSADLANHLSLHSRWMMTERGWRNAHALRRHLAAGHAAHDFIALDD